MGARQLSSGECQTPELCWARGSVTLCFQIEATLRLFRYLFRTTPRLSRYCEPTTARCVLTACLVDGALAIRTARLQAATACRCALHAPLSMMCAQVCERLVDSNMSHGVSIKMIIEAFNPSLPATLRNLFKPTASIQPPPQALSAVARPATAATTSASASSPNSRARGALEETRTPFATHGRPGTSYTDAGIRRCFPFCP
jgi:hypothetical protein